MASLSWDTREGRKEHCLGAVTRIGRTADNDVCLPEAGVSASHAQIVREGLQWVLEDLGSKNGSFVNDEPRTRCALRDGDVVGIAQVDLVFREAEPEAMASEAPTEMQTLVWREDEAVGPVPTDAAPDETERATTPLRELFRGDLDYSHVASIDSQRLATVAFPGGREDPAQLARRLKASYDISRATAATLDTPAVLDRVLKALLGIFEGADRAFILLVDPQTEEVQTAAFRQREGRRASETGISMTAVGRAIRTREALLCRDAAADERFASAQSIMGLGIRSMMIAPLLFRDEVLGVVHIDSVHGVREFSQADLELLSVAAGDVAGCLANARLHERVVASERLAAVGQTLAGLTHCIKNILQGIKGGAYILDKGITLSDLGRVKMGWDMVSRNNAFMEELVYDLLTYSKDREPEYSEANANTLCAEVCEQCREQAKGKSVALDFTPDPALTPVRLDEKGIRRCLLNLVMNAIDACEEGSSVTVETRATGQDGLVRLIVRDTGCGMSKETLAKLFTVFFSTKGSKGTGLGLSVTKKIVEEHGGRIDVESRQGKGTTFTICLPAEPPSMKTQVMAK